MSSDFSEFGEVNPNDSISQTPFTLGVEDDDEDIYGLPRHQNTPSFVEISAPRSATTSVTNKSRVPKVKWSASQLTIVNAENVEVMGEHLVVASVSSKN